MLADVEVVRLDLLLRVLDRRVDPAMLDRLAFLHPEALHDLLDALGAEDAQQIVLQREEETRRPGIALATGAAAQLVVDAPALVALSAEDVDPPRREHLLALSGALRAVLLERRLVRRVVGI